MESQAQIVSRGMRWTPEMLGRAEKGHFYYKIGDKGGQLFLSGATARWKRPEYSRYIYIPSMRIAGNPEDLKSLLQSINASDKDIKEYMINAYSSQNTQVSVKNGGMLEKYEAELSEYTRFRESQVDSKETNTGPSVNLVMLNTLIDALPQAEAIRSIRQNKPGVSSTSSGSSGTSVPAKRPGRRVPFSQRITNLRNGQVLDVSNMREDGTGAKIIAQPGSGSGKMGCTLISGIVSSSLETFRLALQQLNLTADQQQQCLAQWQASRVTSTTTAGSSGTTSSRGRGRKSTKTATTVTTSGGSGLGSVMSGFSGVASIPTLIPQKTVSPRPTLPPPRSGTMTSSGNLPSRLSTLSVGKKSPPRTGFSTLSGMSSLPTLPSLTSPRAMGH